MLTLIIVALVALGLILGSFANALVWRLHGQEELREKIDELKAKHGKKGGQKDKDKADAKKLHELEAELQALSMSTGRSMCSKCHHPLAPKDLVPLFSWLWLHGKCRYCRKPIEDTPLLEAGLPVAFVVSYLFWPLDFAATYGVVAFLFWLVFLTGFAVLTAYDIRWYLLPDKVVWPLVAVAVVQVLLHAFVFDGGTDVLVGAFWGVVMASGIFYVLYQVSRGEWIGGGDVKLGIVLGLLVGGLLEGVLLIFIASLLGTIASVPMLVRGKAKRGAIIPFGPFLMLAAAILVLFGQRIIDWFNTSFLLV